MNKATATINTEIKDYILHFCAFSLTPISDDCILELCQPENWTAGRTKKMIRELVAEGKLIVQPRSSSERYRLNWADYPHYFTPRSDAEYKRFSTFLRNPFYFTNDEVPCRNLLYLQTRQKLQRLQIYHTYFPSSLFIANVLGFMLSSKPWCSLLEHLDSSDSALFLNRMAYCAEQDNSTDLIVKRLSIILSGTQLSTSVRAKLTPIHHLFAHIWRGDLLAADTLIEQEDSTYYYYVKALQQQYAGNCAKAITLYNKGHRLEKKLHRHCYNFFDHDESPLSPYFALMYQIALKEDHKKSSATKLEKIYADFYNAEHVQHAASRLFIYLSLDKKKQLTQLTSALTSKHDRLSEIEFVLMVLVAHHYRLMDVPADWDRRAAALMEQHHWTLLQLESSTELPSLQPRANELKTQLHLHPILKKYAKLEPWQQHLNNIQLLLKNKAPRKAPTTTQSGQQQSRIIYLVNKNNDLSPILQKSKDGHTWTKGRTIALSRMSKGEIEGMSSTDAALSATITKTHSWDGSGYHLGSPHSYTALIDHPHLYLESNPSISVQVKKESPYLSIKRTSKGFTIKSNVTLNGSQTTLISRSSDVLINVYQLSTVQRDIIRLFDEVSTYPPQAEDQLTELTNSIASLITVHSDLIRQDTNLRREAGSARTTVQILPMAEGVKVELFSKPLEERPPYFKAGKGTETCLITDAQGQLVITRQLKKERSNYLKVRNILRSITHDNSIEDTLILDELYDCLELLESLQHMEKELRIEWPKGARLQIRGRIDFEQLQLTARSQGEWFKLNGHVQVDEQLQLTFAELLERSRAHQGRFIELDHGEFLALSNKLRKKLAEIDHSLTPDKKGELKLSPYRSRLLSDLEEEGASLSADKKYTQLQQRIKEAYQLQINIPPTLTAQLRDYQIEGYEWLSRLAAWGAGACLADDMGLGKSVQSIAVLLDRAARGASLIVAPASLMHNWRNEITRFAPSLQCHLLHENIEQREDTIQQATAYDIILTTYGLLTRISESLQAKSWNIVLLDEAHNIKNRDTKSSKIAMSLQAEFRLALTGTPLQNHLGEIWNLFQFTNPGLLGSFEQFSQRFITPIDKEKNRLKQQQLKHILQPFLLRRTKGEVLDELPAKTEIIHHVELSPAERAIYENIRQSAINNITHGELNPIQTLAEITKLRQAACHPSLIDEALSLPSSAKLTRLIEIVHELIDNGHRALIFSQFTSLLTLVREMLEPLHIPHLYLDGQTPIKERARLVEQYQHGDIPLFLISLKAGGTGLNLTAADYVIHLDPWWNPAIEDQASDRSHRIGQTRPVTIYKLIAAHTIEERILDMHKNKKSLSDALLEGGDMATKLTKKDILNMLQDHL